MQHFALVVDDDSKTRDLILNLANSLGLRGIAASGIQEALANIQQHRPEIVFTQLDIADGNGLSLQVHLRSLLPQAYLVLMCYQPQVETVIEALRCGVSDLLLRPVNSISVRAAFERANIGVGRSASSANSSAIAPLSASDNAVTVALSGSLKQIKRSVAEATVMRFDGNKSAAARALGIPRRSLYRILTCD